MKNATFINIAKPTLLVLLILTGYLIYKVIQIEKSTNNNTEYNALSEESRSKKSQDPIIRTAGEVVDSAAMDYEDIKLFSKRYFSIVEKTSFEHKTAKFNAGSIISKTTMTEPLGISYLWTRDSVYGFVGFRVEDINDIENITSNTRVVLSRIFVDDNVGEFGPFSMAITPTHEIMYHGEGSFSAGQKYEMFVEHEGFSDGKVVLNYYIVVEGEKAEDGFFLLRDRFFHKNQRRLDNLPKLQTEEKLESDKVNEEEEPYLPLPKGPDPDIPEMN